MKMFNRSIKTKTRRYTVLRVIYFRKENLSLFRKTNLFVLPKDRDRDFYFAGNDFFVSLYANRLTVQVVYFAFFVIDYSFPH